jgi:hypothetical protein
MGGLHSQISGKPQKLASEKRSSLFWPSGGLN